MSLLGFVLFTGDDISLGDSQGRGIALGVRRVLKQHPVVVLGLAKQTTVNEIFMFLFLQPEPVYLVHEFRNTMKESLRLNIYFLFVS